MADERTLREMFFDELAAFEYPNHEHPTAEE
jgi:hypothetical protein